MPGTVGVPGTRQPLQSVGGSDLFAWIAGKGRSAHGANEPVSQNKVHHILSVTGLVLVTLHLFGVAVDATSPSVFLPRFDSWVAFLELGGRPAWYLIAVASLVAVLRQTIDRNWRAIHFLNYVAFLLATVHAIMIGTDFQHTIVKAVPVALALVIVAIFIQKRRR